ncbi:DMT family transporter [Algihabitans albus]|uniref:DMT family transporter n=1 Tax=Algihabitans albus TaxID=2164067 RepID=UPI000E5CECD4|nr:DMT family transporter [Algihabitans albus]
MEAWIFWTLGGAFFQNLRSALQKRLKDDLGTQGSAFARFVYAFPLALVYLLATAEVGGVALPAIHGTFLAYAVLGAAAQIFATVCLIEAFGHRNFAVATAYSKTDTVQAAVFGLILLGDALSPLAGLGIVISLAGVIAISLKRQQAGWGQLLTGWLQPAARLGIASGAGFALSSVCYRAASLSLEPVGAPVQAATTLAWVLGLQTLAMGAWLAWRRPAQLRAVFASWRVSAWVGAAGMAASVGWFTAMTLENAAHVRALGQVELVFSLAASCLFFKERSTAVELLGIAAVVGGIVILLLGTG